MNRVKIINQEQADELYRRLPKPDKYIFAIGLETGLRISDILRIRKCDVANPMNVYVSRLKTVLPFPLSDWLHNELISHAEFFETYIFPSSRSWRRSMHRTTYHRHIKIALEGLSWDASAHSSRIFYLMTSPLQKAMQLYNDTRFPPVS